MAPTGVKFQGSGDAQSSSKHNQGEREQGAIQQIFFERIRRSFWSFLQFG